MNLKLLIGLALLSSLGTAHAESAAELQSRCGNDAAAFFTRKKQQDYESNKTLMGSEPSPATYDYENHYSESMKGCFIVVTDVIYDHARQYSMTTTE